MQKLPTLHLDFETRSVVDVTVVGPAAYAAHPSTEVTAMACTIEHPDGRLEKLPTWYRTCGRKLKQPLKGKFILAAHNAAFEREIWNRVCVARYGFEPQPIDLFSCSAARAAMLGLPQSLAGLAQALGLATQKDAEGRRLMMETTTPKAVLDKPNLFGECGPVFEESPDKFRRVAQYCERDVEVEIAADTAMGPLTPTERIVWLMDQRINARGITIDRELCAKTLKMLGGEILLRSASLGKLTGGAVTAPTQPAALVNWLATQGIEVHSVAKDIVATLLEGDLPPLVRTVLEIRRDSAKSSTAKFDRMLSRSEHDGRMRDNLRYHGAFTGRWAGSGAQVQNYPRGNYEDATDLIDTFNTGDVDTVELFYGDPIAAAPSILRGCLTAAPGKSLLVWDYKQIEARVLPWLAGETWKVKAFAELDRDPTLPDLYKRAFSDSFRTPVYSVTKDQRQAGKVCELALGYQGGPGAFVSMQKIYRVEIADYLGELCEKFPDVARKATEAYDRRGRGTDIGKATWIAAEIVKINWRKRNPATVRYWYGLQDAAIEAMERGESSVRNIRFIRTERFLKCVLPSSRALSYFRPYVSYENNKPSLSYWHTKDGKLLPTNTYGGKLSENITQAVARDVMAEGMHRLERNDFIMLMTVHDEVVAEEETKLSVGRLAVGSKLLERRPRWAKSLPLAVDAFAARRYKK